MKLFVQSWGPLILGVSFLWQSQHHYGLHKITINNYNFLDPVQNMITLSMITLNNKAEVYKCYKPLMPRAVEPEATACRAYSICTSFPEGLNVVKEKS